MDFRLVGENGDTLEGSIKKGHGLFVHLKDHGNNTFDNPEEGCVFALEPHYDTGEATLYVFADIDSEAPTHIISLKGAKFR